MISHRITVTTEFTEKSILDITEFIEKVKNSFEKVEIISIENIPMNYEKYARFTYRIKFNHNLYLES
jgi:hypothetical protein